MDPLEMLELAGTDDDDTALMGARRGRRRGRRRARTRKRRARRDLTPKTPGAPGPGIGLWPQGFNTVIFGNIGPTALTAIGSPQKPFQGQRLVVDIVRTGAGSGGAVSIAQLLIGQASQLLDGNPIGAGAFPAAAFDVRMSLQPATPGINITVQYLITSLPGVGDTVDITTTLFGMVAT